MKPNTKWDVRFMRLAKEISTWSKDPSSKLGAVIVNEERRILATGYNGFPSKLEDTEERLHNRDLKYPLIIHAEMNALLNALYSGISVKNSTLYVYGLPICSDCAKCVIQAGITRIVILYPEDAPVKWLSQWNEKSKPMFKEANISATFLNPITFS